MSATATLPDGKRVRVFTRFGVPGFFARWSQHCTGCTETPENTSAPERGSGCHECGYTGRRRRVEWVPLEATS